MVGEIDAGALGILSDIKVGVLSTVSPDGSPYAIPINFIVKDGSIIFHGRDHGMKVDNLTKDPRCCLTAYTLHDFDKTGDDACNTYANYESVIVKGTVRTIEDPDEKMDALRALVNTILPSRSADPIGRKAVDITKVFVITIEDITLKCHIASPDNQKYTL